MKNIFKTAVTALAMLFTVTACTDSPDDLTGKYALDTYRYTTVDEQETAKLGRGVKQIGITFKADDRNELHLDFGTKEWVLPAVSYKFVPVGPVGDGEFTGYMFIDGTLAALGDRTEVTLTADGEGNYEIMLISYVNGRNVKCLYSGPIEFEIGEDDPEASGYTIAIAENPVTDADNQVYPDLIKYAITVSDPDGNAVFEIDAVNKAGASLDELTGTYTVAGYPTQAGLADNGWVVYMPEYGLELNGGTYFTDANGTKQFVTSGSITISRAEDAQGTPLYSFAGEGLATLTSKNVPGTDGRVNIMFATYTKVDKTGTVLRDLTMPSAVMGKEMLYSVYLPPDWAWENPAKYPVIYLLHGANGPQVFGDGAPGNNAWLDGGKIAEQMDKAVAEGTFSGAVVVMPNCTVDGNDLFYCNDYQGDAQYMTFFFDEFMPAVEGQFNIDGRRERRMVGGLSMGGYGSLYYGGIHPEMFGYVYACSPAAIVDGAPNLFDIYGGLLATGTELPGITVEIGTEDFLFESCGWFTGFLGGAGVQFEHITRAGAHDWAFWTGCTPKIVNKAAELFAQ